VSDSTELVCLTEKFDKVQGLSQEITAKININGVPLVNTLKLKMKDFNRKGTILTPNSVSPVLKQKLVFTIESAFPFALKKEDFTVNATLVKLSPQVSPYYPQNENTRIRKMNVVEVNDATKTLTVMYGGAYSGTYSVTIRHIKYGLVDGEILTLTVGSHVTSYSPMSGSIYGGTLLTIKGTNWDPKIKTNNPVSIVYNGALGATPCFVQTTAID
jgi:hypothetical protein